MVGKGAPVTRRKLFGNAGQAAAAVGAVSALAATTTPALAAPSKLTGKLQVVVNLDFNKNYNTFLKDSITDYAGQKLGGADKLDMSDLAGFLGSSDVYQKLQAQKAAGTPVDLIIHTLSGLLMDAYDLTTDVRALVDRQVAKYGKVYGSARASLLINNQWKALPFHDRTGGFWVRKDKFANVGLSVANGDFETWDQVLSACRAVTDPSNDFYGWGMTANRSGDGETLVWDTVQAWGGALTDATGQVITLFSPETIDAMNWLRAIYADAGNASMLPPGVNAWGDPSNNEAWLAGKIAFTSNAGTLYAQSVVDNTTLPDGTVVKDVTDLALAPIGPYGVRLQGSGGTHFFFMKGSKNFDEAAQLADFLIDPNFQRNLWKIGQGYTVPAYSNLWDDPIIANDRISSVFKPVSLAEPPFSGVAYRGPVSVAADAVSQQNLITDMFGTILAGKDTVTAVHDAHAQAVDIFKQFGFKGE